MISSNSLGAFADLAEDAQHSFAAEEQRVERTRHRGDRSGAGKVDMLVDLGRHLGDDEQPRDAAVAHGDRLGADRHQHVVLQRPRQAFGILLDEHDRDRGRRAQPFLQPAQLEIGDRGQEDQHFRDHHEEHGEHQQLGRQAARQRHRPCRCLFGSLRVAWETLSLMPVDVLGLDGTTASAEKLQQAHDAAHQRSSRLARQNR